jgi:hypothetical protein
MATLLVNTGRAIITNRIKGSGTEPLFVAWGTGAGTTGATDTTLFTETGTRTSGTSTQQTTSTTNDSYQVIGTITAAGALTITNAGLFDVVTSSSGNLFIKGDFTGVVLALGDAIQFTIKAQFS